MSNQAAKIGRDCLPLSGLYNKKLIPFRFVRYNLAKWGFGSDGRASESEMKILEREAV